MIKVTVSNVTKIAEDHLYIALDKAHNAKDQDLILVIEAELDRRAEAYERSLKLKQTTETKKLELRHAIESEVQEIFNGYKGKLTLILIQKLGQEFIDDYIIDAETFTVHSLVARHNQNSSWTHETMDKAVSKKASLIYDRIYDHYMRDATTDKLEMLKKLLES